MLYNRSVTVIYPAGTGGEFFCWLMSQNAGFGALGVNLNADTNKWTLHTHTTPMHHHLLNVGIQFKEYKFHPDYINIMRDHLMLDADETQSFLQQRYDCWSESLLVYLGPISDSSKQLTMTLRDQKLKGVSPGIKVFDKSLEKFQQAVGNRKTLIVDNSVLLSEPAEKLTEVYQTIASHFSIKSTVFPQTVGSFLEFWRSKNNIHH